jgi:hypothetical protein
MPSIKLIISAFMVMSIFLGLCLPVEAQADTLYVESNGSRIIEVNVSTEFTIEIWIRNQTAQATAVYFTIVFDPDSMEVVGAATTPPGGWGAGTSDLGPGQIGYVASGSGFQGDLSWYSLTFHCLDAGNTPINVIDAVYTDLGGSNHTLNVLKASVSQIPVTPVGGISTTVNKLEILTPYIVLVGLIVAISTLIIIKKRKD